MVDVVGPDRLRIEVDPGKAVDLKIEQTRGAHQRARDRSGCESIEAAGGSRYSAQLSCLCSTDAGKSGETSPSTAARTAVAVRAAGTLSTTCRLLRIWRMLIETARCGTES